MKETIDWLISEIDEVLKASDEDLFEIAYKNDLYHGVCYKLHEGGFSEELYREVDSIGKNFIDNKIDLPKCLDSIYKHYWFVCCNEFEANLDPELGRLSLEARKTVLEGILSTL